ncbi:TetR/AcrR family transcriptional regulator [Amycolatopsis taiwanensis]|uniref:TetR family transcriptional regulator n=1 Tax=Amycolatopsis taiwanensis TaxID=342230 RepID=A0A9W6R357_9PSEU|nr:TetR family transcriptional regulator [Amycolatopsis taiwanensis]GLY67663.1 TetR family transcriptional regulator [Amycolatopsis taiwanensis]
MQITADMQPDLGLSVTEAARRAQILTATIGTIAEHGYAGTSFERIRERAGLSSTRIITYHFGTKQNLMTALLGTIIHVKDRYLTERAGSGEDRVAALRAHIESELAFLRAHPSAVRALAEIARNATGEPVTDALLADLRMGRLARQLGQGQREGVFGEFDAGIMARTIAQAVDGAAAALADNPELDLDAYGQELAALFEKATAP